MVRWIWAKAKLYGQNQLGNTPYFSTKTGQSLRLFSMTVCVGSKSLTNGCCGSKVKVLIENAKQLKNANTMHKIDQAKRSLSFGFFQ